MINSKNYFYFYMVATSTEKRKREKGVDREVLEAVMIGFWVSSLYYLLILCAYLYLSGLCLVRIICISQCNSIVLLQLHISLNHIITSSGSPGLEFYCQLLRCLPWPMENRCQWSKPWFSLISFADTSLSAIDPPDTKPYTQVAGGLGLWWSCSILTPG